MAGARPPGTREAAAGKRGGRGWEDILPGGDEWVDGRLGEWLDGRLADWAREQAASGREPSAKERAKKRAALEGERMMVAEKRAELTMEYARAQTLEAGMGGRRNGG